LDRLKEAFEAIDQLGDISGELGVLGRLKPMKPWGDSTRFPEFGHFLSFQKSRDF
jgi:hypothetical protein